MSHPPPLLPPLLLPSFFPFGEGQRADCAIVSRAAVQAEAFLADFDGTRSPLMSQWIDRGDWGQERVAPQIGYQEKNLLNFGKELQSPCCFSGSTDQSRLHRPTTFRAECPVSSVSTPSRHSFQSERATDRVFKNPPPALREQLLSWVIKTEAEEDLPRTPEGRSCGGRPFPAVKVFNQ